MLPAKPAKHVNTPAYSAATRCQHSKGEGGPSPTPVLAFDIRCWPAFKSVTCLNFNLLATEQTEAHSDQVKSEDKIARNKGGGGILSADSTIIPFVLQTSGYIIYNYISHPYQFDGDLWRDL